MAESIWPVCDCTAHDGPHVHPSLLDWIDAVRRAQDVALAREEGRRAGVAEAVAALEAMPVGWVSTYCVDRIRSLAPPRGEGDPRDCRIPGVVPGSWLETALAEVRRGVPCPLCGGTWRPRGEGNEGKEV